MEKEFLPYLQSIYRAECALKQKQKELTGLENSIIRIGTFTSVSRNILPQLMKQFKKIYPGCKFHLKTRRLYQHSKMGCRQKL